MKRLCWWWLGVREFRADLTTAVPDRHRESYDRGREVAHRATLRRFDLAT